MSKTQSYESYSLLKFYPTPENPQIRSVCCCVSVFNDDYIKIIYQCRLNSEISKIIKKPEFINWHLFII